MTRKAKKIKQDNVGVCALCREQEKLCLSHIIPEFLFASIYDEKHTFHSLSTSKDSKYKRLQIGVRERLLCRKCEQLFSKYERYARGILYGGEQIQVPKKVQHGFVVMVDYKKFKLFQLSLIWRAGISTVLAFTDIKLGGHEDRLREMLLKEIPGDSEEYGCLLAWPTTYRNIFDESIMYLEKLDFNGSEAYLFVFGGMFWLFVLSQNPDVIALKQSFLQCSGELRILHGDLGLGLDLYVRNLVRDLYKNNLDAFSKG